MKSNNDEYLKKILKEADAVDADASMQKTLNLVLKNSAMMSSEIQPPAGYESALLNSLKAQLPKAHKESVKNRGGATLSLVGEMFSFLKSPQLSWSVSASLAVFVAVMVWVQKGGTVSGPELAAQQNDMLTQTASRSGEKVANDWLASMGDSGIRAGAGRSLSSLADELESQDKAAVDRALNQVAREMGMKKL